MLRALKPGWKEAKALIESIGSLYDETKDEGNLIEATIEKGKIPEWLNIFSI